jgi:hypothetical protein
MGFLGSAVFSNKAKQNQELTRSPEAGFVGKAKG